MEAVRTGTQKVTMNSAESDYQQKLRAAKAQADGNPYTSGVQETGQRVKDTRTPYGAVTEMPEESTEGPRSNFAQSDAPGNSPAEDALNQTGDMDMQTSATNVPQEDPADFQTDALNKRLQMYAKAGQGFSGHNDRSQVIS